MSRQAIQAQLQGEMLDGTITLIENSQPDIDESQPRLSCSTGKNHCQSPEN